MYTLSSRDYRQTQKNAFDRVIAEKEAYIKRLQRRLQQQQSNRKDRSFTSDGKTKNYYAHEIEELESKIEQSNKQKQHLIIENKVMSEKLKQNAQRLEQISTMNANELSKESLKKQQVMLILVKKYSLSFFEIQIKCRLFKQFSIQIFHYRLFISFFINSYNHLKYLMSQHPVLINKEEFQKGKMIFQRLSEDKTKEAYNFQSLNLQQMSKQIQSLQYWANNGGPQNNAEKIKCKYNIKLLQELLQLQSMRVIRIPDIIHVFSFLWRKKEVDFKQTQKKQQKLPCEKTEFEQLEQKLIKYQ